MDTYAYTAKDKEGNLVKGTIEGYDERNVVGLLRKEELFVISIKAQPKKAFSGPNKGKGRKIKLSELVIFARQLTTIIESGIPLIQGLEVLHEQIEDANFKMIIAELKKDIAAGSSFHEALEKYPRAFSPLFVNMVKAGEASGTLDEILDKLASHLERIDSLTRKVKSAMAYPIIVSIFALIVTSCLLIFIVPVFADIYKDFGSQLPPLTQAIINISDFARNYFIFIGIAIGVLIFFVSKYIQTRKGRRKFDRFKLRLPIFGPILHKVAISKFARTLATLIRSGVPIITALDIVKKATGNVLIEEAIDGIKDSISQGATIALPLTKSKLFPPLVVRMISIGEQTGELEKMLSKIADFYDDQVNAAIATITSLIEPILIVFLGIVVGTVVIAMFLPIFKLPSVVATQ